MQSGQYIVERWMVSMIREICRVRKISVSAFSDDWLLHLEKDDKTARILGYKFSLNDSVAGNIAQDKVASYELLAHYNVPALPHYLIRTKATRKHWESLSWSSGMVLKPLNGTSGHGIAKVNSVADAEAWMNKLGIEAWATSPFVEITREVRVIVLDKKVLLAYEKQPVEMNGLRFFNLGKGAIAKDYELTPAQKKLVGSAQKALGLRLAAVDIIQNSVGKWCVLEVNDGIMMENYARYSTDNARCAKDIYAAIIDVMI